MMNDQLERRLQDADPLAAGDGRIPATARLDAIKESVMAHEERRSPRARRRLLPLGLATLAASTLVIAVLVANLASAHPALAFSPIPTPVNDAVRAVATKVCAASPEGALPGTGSIHGSDGNQPGTFSANRPAPTGPGVPWTPDEFPPLVALELHGNGGVALFENDSSYAACMLLADGDTFVRGEMVTWWGPRPASGLDGAAIGGEINGEKVTMVTGTAPADAVRIDVVGNGLNGTYANVINGAFALWVPATADPQTLVARDASGAEIDRIDIRLKTVGGTAIAP